jgi:hypothetical protein
MAVVMEVVLERLPIVALAAVALAVTVILAQAAALALSLSVISSNRRQTWHIMQK